MGSKIEYYIGCCHFLNDKFKLHLSGVRISYKKKNCIGSYNFMFMRQTIIIIIWK